MQTDRQTIFSYDPPYSRWNNWLTAFVCKSMYSQHKDPLAV